MQGGCCSIPRERYGDIWLEEPIGWFDRLDVTYEGKGGFKDGVHISGLISWGDDGSTLLKEEKLLEWECERVENVSGKNKSLKTCYIWEMVKPPSMAAGGQLDILISSSKERQGLGIKICFVLSPDKHWTHS